VVLGSAGLHGGRGGAREEGRELGRGAQRSKLACADTASPSPGRPGERAGEAGEERVLESGRSVGEQCARELGVERRIRSPRTSGLYHYPIIRSLVTPKKIHLPETQRKFIL